MNRPYVFDIPQNTERAATNKHWQFCVGSGQAKLAVRSDYAKQLKYIHDELGIQRVRFHGIFDDSMQAYMGMDDYVHLPGAKNFNNYNFRNIGVAYDAVLEAGMQPWVELSFMPSRLAKNSKNVTANSDGKCSMPKSDEKWVDFIQAFIRFLLHRYGDEEVETWFFEVWNEPNMPLFFSGSMEDYFHLYEITSQAVKRVNPKLRVGGPSSAVGVWIPEFIDFCESRHLPLDFISTHFYPGSNQEESFFKFMFNAKVGGTMRLFKLKSGRALDGYQMILQDKTEMCFMPKGQMYDVTRRIHEQIAQRYPIYYSEWNCNAILMSPTNDDKKVACFQIKSIDEMEPYVTGSSIWSFSDIFDEFTLIPDQFSGGFGLLTIDGIPKPQFHALKLMSTAGEKKLVLPHTNDEVEISVYESKDGKKKQVFVFRQRMKNSEDPACDYLVNVEMERKPQKITHYRIDKDYCNPKRVWNEMGSPIEMNRQEINYICNNSKLVPICYDGAWDGKYISLAGSMFVNDVHYYEIEQ